MGSEIGILGLYGLVVIITIMVQAGAAQGQVGQLALLKPRDDMPRLTGVAGRLDRAQINSVTAMALFAPAVLMLAQNGLATTSTLHAAQAFLIARILYVPLYAFGVVGLRTLVWVIGIVATIWIYVVALGWV
ncbi:MAG: MAPEG family protein [Pseudorhodobacter sp.]|nr:MAPEG family protein [Pseudorhodobacter sp.]